MAENNAPFNDGDRVSHQVKGLGTVRHDPSEADLVVSLREEAKAGDNLVYVVWDDARFPVAKVPAGELEAVPPASEAISTGV